MRRYIFILALAGLLTGCGGGGGSGDGVVFQSHDLGRVSSTSVTPFVVGVDNPRAETVLVSSFSVDGPFQVAPGTLPVALDPGETIAVELEFVPNGTPGLTAGQVVLDFEGASQTSQRGIDLLADGEEVELLVLTTTLDFGEVLLGDSSEADIQALNLSIVSHAHVGPIDLPADFEVVTALPLDIAPGETGTITVRYTPGGAALEGASASVHSEDPDGPFQVNLTASSNGREIIDFGSQAFDTSLSVPFNFTAQTQDMQFDVPTDAIGFQIEAYSGGLTQIGLSKLTGPNGENFEDENFNGFYLQYPDVQTFVAQVPNSDAAHQQVVPGTWTFRIGRLTGFDGDVDVRVIIQRRAAGNAKLAVLDLNVFLAEAIALDKTNAGTDFDFQDVITRVNSILSAQGVQIGDIDYYDIADIAPVPSVYDDVSNAEFPGLLSLSGHASVVEERLNFFLVREALGGGVLGVSAKLGGPTRNGTGASGVMGLYIDTPSPGQRDLVARVMAHEMGHYLGLRHTAEGNGAHDYIADTTDCGSSSCSDATEKYLMHWQALTKHKVLTDGQGAVIRAHGHMRPATGSTSVSTLTLEAPSVHVTTAFDLTVSQNWCGTCGRCKSKTELGLGN